MTEFSESLHARQACGHQFRLCGRLVSEVKMPELVVDHRLYHNSAIYLISNWQCSCLLWNARPLPNRHLSGLPRLCLSCAVGR